MPKLSELRNAAGLTQKALAEKSGVPLSYIKHLENGRRGINVLALNKALALADALQCQPRDLLQPPE